LVTTLSLKQEKRKRKLEDIVGGIIIYFKKEFTKVITYLKEATLSQKDFG
jgi:hypothetical protein